MSAGTQMVRRRTLHLHGVGAESTADGEAVSFFEGADAMEELCKGFGGSALDAIEKIVANMGISQAEADRLVSKYW